MSCPRETATQSFENRTLNSMRNPEDSYKKQSGFDCEFEENSEQKPSKTVKNKPSEFETND